MRQIFACNNPRTQLEAKGFLLAKICRARAVGTHGWVIYGPTGITCGLGDAVRLLVTTFGVRLDINAANTEGETALLSASRAGQSEMITILLRNRADLRPSKRRESPLHWLGAFPTDHFGIARLMLGSAERRDWESRLLQKASSVSYTQYWGSEFPAGTPLHRAVYFKLPPVVETLMNLGADPNEPSGQGSQFSALQLVCRTHQASVPEIMLSRMGVEDVTKMAGPPLLHIALSGYGRLLGLFRKWSSRSRLGSTERHRRYPDGPEGETWPSKLQA